MAKRKKVTKLNTPVLLSIVVPVYGQAKLLKKCLDSIKRTCVGLDYKVVLVDDNSPADPLLSDLYAEYGVLRNTQNQGFAFSCNRGAAAVDSKYILFLNSDIELKEGCIQSLLATIENKSIPFSPHTPQNSVGIGIVSPKLLFPPDSSSPYRPAGKVQHAGLCFSLGVAPKHRLIGWDENHPKVNAQRELQAVSGACLLINREVWNKIYNAHKQISDPSIGAFNQIYGKGTYEDVELCLAARGFGYRVIYEPQAVAYHYTNGSSEVTGFPVNRNQSIFNARCGHLIAYDEWMLL